MVAFGDCAGTMLHHPSLDTPRVPVSGTARLQRRRAHRIRLGRIPPVQQSQAPRDFDYLIKGGGAEFELTVLGWDDDILYYDSERLP